MEREGTCPRSVGFQVQIQKCLHFSFSGQVKQNQTIKKQVFTQTDKRFVSDKLLEKPSKADGAITKLSLPLERRRQISGV